MIPSDQPNASRELTFGEKTVNIKHNPSGDPKVDEVKILYSKILDVCHELRNAGISENHPQKDERYKMFSIAIQEAESSQMWAVKAITHTL